MQRERIYRVCRANLVWACQEGVRELVECSVREEDSSGAGDMSDALGRFCDTLESVLLFGLKDKRCWYSGDKLGFWEFLRTALTKSAYRARVRSVEQLDHVKTQAGRGRAFLRMALVEKTLADYFRCAATNREAVRRFYHPHSILLSPEAEIIWGRLTALSGVDFALCLKDTNLDLKIDPTPDFAHYAQLHVHRQTQQQQQQQQQLSSASTSPMHPASIMDALALDQL